MIRELRETDIDKVAEIWLDTNLKAHDFISAEYWKKNFDMVKQNGEVTMIRELRETDIDKVAEIWLDTNLKAHDFISAEYWKKNFDMVREMFSQAEIYVYEKENKLVGFIGLNGEYIEGIFVHDTVQSQGIGKQLLN